MRSASKWVLLACGVVVEVCASLSLRAALANPWWFLAVGVGYTLSFALFFLALKRGLPLGVGYGIWGALGISLTAVISAVLFGEPLTPGMIAGIGLAVAGVLVVQLGSQLASKRTAVH